MSNERTCFWLQYDPYLISVECSYTEIPIGDKLKDGSPKKLKILIAVPYVVHLKVQVLSFNMNLISSP